MSSNGWHVACGALCAGYKTRRKMRDATKEKVANRLWRRNVPTFSTESAFWQYHLESIFPARCERIFLSTVPHPQFVFVSKAIQKSTRTPSFLATLNLRRNSANTRFSPHILLSLLPVTSKYAHSSIQYLSSTARRLIIDTSIP